MGFIVNPKRRIKFYHTVKEEDVNGNPKEPIEFSVTFDFVIAEDLDYGELRTKLDDKAPIEIIDPKTEKPMVDPKTGETIDTKGAMNAYLYTLRVSLIDCEGIDDPDGNVLEIIKDGKIIQDNQKAIFEAITKISDLWEKIQTAYVGHKGKN